MKAPTDCARCRPREREPGERNSANGKILAAGSPEYSNLTLSRYRPDGGLDAGFGNGGTVTTTVGSSGDILGALALQSDGKIVVAGTCANARHTNMSLVRYNSDGSLDLTFARDGKVTTRIGTGILGR